MIKLGKFIKQNILPISAFIIGSAVIVFYKYPLLHSFYGYDQSVYLYEGKALSLGAIPFREVWDIRMLGLGYIFTLLYKVGLSSLTDFRIFQILWMIMTLLVFSWLLGQFSKNKFANGIGVIFLAFLMVNYQFYGYDEGYVEIFSLVFLILPLIFLLLYQRSARLIWLILTGLSIISAFMLRISNIDLFLPIVIFLYLFEGTRSNSIGATIVATIKSFAIVLLTFLIPLVSYLFYLGHHGALVDLFDAVIRFNSYYGSTIPDLNRSNAGLYTKILYIFNNLIRNVKTFPISYLTILLGTVILIKNRKPFDILVLLFFLVSIVNVAIGLKPWPHYLIQLYPFIALLGVATIITISDNFTAIFSQNKSLSFLVLAIFAFYFIYPYILQPFSDSITWLQTVKAGVTPNSTYQYQVSSDPVTTYARQHFQSGDYAVYWSDYYRYLSTDMRSSTRYFSNPLSDYWGLKNTFVSQRIIDNCLTDLEKNPPKIIVYDTVDFLPDSPVINPTAEVGIYINNHYIFEPTLSQGTQRVYIKK